jgi:hypothetical protein
MVGIFKLKYGPQYGLHGFWRFSGFRIYSI